mgnify:CR=1 FL=1
MGVDLPFSGIHLRVFIKVCSFSNYFEIELIFFCSCTENTIDDYIPERSVQPMGEKNAGYSHSGINRKLRKDIKLRWCKVKLSLLMMFDIDGGSFTVGLA